MGEHEALAVEHFEQETYEVFAPARDHRVGFHGFVQQDVERVEVHHANAPAIDRHLHAASIVEIETDSFGSAQCQRAGVRKFGFGPAALRASGCCLAQVFLQSLLKSNAHDKAAERSAKLEKS
jgi:hypothetical protein